MKVKIIYRRFFQEFLLDPETQAERDALIKAVINNSDELCKAIEAAIEKERTKYNGDLH